MQVAADIERIADLQVNQVLFANAAPIDIENQVGVLEALQSAVNP